MSDIMSDYADVCKERDALKEEVEAQRKYASSGWQESKRWKSLAEKAREALEKIAFHWFDPNKTETVCGNCDGGLHGWPEGTERHDADCSYQIAKEALSSIAQAREGGKE